MKMIFKEIIRKTIYKITPTNFLEQTKRELVTLVIKKIYEFL